MADKTDIMLELERRGKLPADKQKLLDEARRRGLVDDTRLMDEDFVAAPEASPDGREVIPDTDPRAGLPIPGTVSEFEAQGGDVSGSTPSRTFGLGRTDTLNPIPAIAAGADSAVGSIPIVGGRLTGLRDQANAAIYGDTPADARADMDKTVAANPVPAVIGEAVGTSSPYIAAAMVGGPLAGALGLEGTLLSRVIMGTLSNTAIKTGDKMSEGEKPLQALGNASREAAFEAPFFALGTKSGRQATVAKAPKTDELFTEAGRLYDQVRDSKLLIAQPNADAFINTATAKLQSSGLDETLTPGTVAVVKRMQTMTGRNMSIDDAMLVRTLANDAWKNAKPGSNDRRLARQIVRDVDDFLTGVASSGPQGQPNMAVISGDPVLAKTALDEANKINSAAFKASTIDEAIELAVANAEQSGRSLESTLKTEFGKLNRAIIKDNPERFSPEEAKLIREVATGSGGQRLASFLGSTLYPRGPVSALPTLATGGGAFLGSGGDPVLTTMALGAPMAIGSAGRALSSSMARESADYAGATIRSRALGNNIVSGRALEMPPVIRSLPVTASLTARSMTLGEYERMNAAY